MLDALWALVQRNWTAAIIILIVVLAKPIRKCISALVSLCVLAAAAVILSRMGIIPSLESIFIR